MKAAFRFLMVSCACTIVLVSSDGKAQCGMTASINAIPGFPWNLCPGQNIILTSSVSGGTFPYTYLWSNGAITSNTTIIPPYYGEVYLQVTDATGCVAYTQIHIKAWVWTVQIVYNPTSVCEGDSIAVSAWPDFPPGTTFLWSTGQTTNPIYITSTGTYSLTVTDPTLGCTATTSQNVFISYWPAIDPVITGPAVLCPGQNATLVAQENPGYFFLWNTGEVTNTINISAPGLYSVTVSNFAGCFGTDTLEVLPGSAPPVLTAPSVLCNGQNGTISIANAGSYTSFLWNNGATTSNITINSAGTYSVTVTAPGGCISSGSVTVVAGNSNMSMNGSTTPVTSCATPNGSINLTVNPPGSYAFNWSNGANTEDINNLSAGNYTVTVTDTGGCTSSSSFFVTSSVVIPSTNTNITSTSCGLGNGSVDLNVNPAGTYNFLWSNGANTEDIFNILAGIYSVTVTSSSGCTVTTSVSVLNNNPVINVNGNSSPFTSCATPNGAIDITPTPSGTYSYAWSNGSTTEDLGNLLSGTYTVTVSAGGSCASTATFNVANNTTPPLPLATTTADTCGQGTGSIDITVTPIAAYTFLWSNGVVTEDQVSIPAGIYSMTVTSTVNGCTATLIETVTNYIVPIVLNATSTASTCGQNNGAVDLNILPTGTYSFIWSNGSISEDLNLIPGGNYFVTVTSADGCTNTANVLVPENTISLTINGTTSPNTSCMVENGTVDIAVNPAGTYSYAWSNGASTEDLNNVQAGIYTVTVTLGLTCVNTKSFEVLNNFTLISISGITTPNSSCSQPNGIIDITVGIPGFYTYLWSNGETTEDLQQLTGGIYSVTVTGNDGCTSTETFDIINTNSNFAFNGYVVPNTSCISPNGNIDLTLSPPGTYSFVWNIGATTEDLQNLAAGLYGVTVTDINNCAAVESFLVDDNLSYPVISSQITPSSCGSNNGSIEISVLPSTGNVYSWSNGENAEDLFNLVSGVYALTVTGANGCVINDTFTVGNQNSNFQIIGIPHSNSSCNNYNGSIDLTILPAGTYSFIWSDGTTTEDLENMAAGAYSVIVTDVLNCTSKDTFQIGNTIALPVFSANILPATCGANNGAIDLTLTPPLNNTFLWSQGSITQDLSNLFPGIYSVIVTDTSGCQSLDTFTVQNINNNFSLSAVPVPNTSCNTPNGSIDLSVTPAGIYIFYWSNGEISEDLVNLIPGTYIVTVTDNSACSSMATFTVSNNANPVTISSLITPSGCGQGNGAIDVTITPSNGNVFLWSNGATTEDIQNLAAGNYSLTVTGSNGCIIADTFNVMPIGSNISLSGIPTANTNCIQPNGALDLFASPLGAYTFIWSNGSSNEDQVNLSPGIYTVTVSDSNGCSAASSFGIADQTILPVITEIITPSSCGGSNGQIDLTILPGGIYTFSWSNGSVNEDLQNVTVGNYSVTVTSLNGCTASSAFLVPNTNSNFSISGITTGNTSCVNANGSIDVTVTPAGNYTFTWSTGANTEDLQNLSFGIYSLTVTDLSNCSTTGLYIVDDLIVDVLVAPSISPGLCGDANGNIDLTVIPSPGNNFLWSNGQTYEDLVDVSPGIYAVTITGQNGCIWSSSFTLPVSEKVTIDLQADLDSGSGDSTIILAQVNIDPGAIDTVLWFPESLFYCTQNICMQQTILTPAQSTQIMIMVMDTNGCMGEARLILDSATKPIVYIPNVFTPNHDDVNDRFTLYGNKDVKLILELQIFDRWGNQVFVNNEFPPNEENYGWDGVFKNQLMNPAVFAYWARVRFADGSVGQYKGDVTLIR